VLISKPHDEPYLGYFDRRIGEAMILLSLDSISPYLPLIEFKSVPSGGQFQACIRGCILMHRKSDSELKPSLLPLILETVTKSLGQRVSDDLEYWLENIYVFSSFDYSKYSAWNVTIADIFKNRIVIDENFGLSDNIARIVQQNALESLSLADFHRVEDEQENVVLSEWDTEMYTRHSLFSEMRDPLVPVKLTFKQLRFRRFVSWLIEHTDATNLAFFQDRAREAVAKNGDGANGVSQLPDIATLALPNA
jgi:hypothetical protein